MKTSKTFHIWLSWLLILTCLLGVLSMSSCFESHMRIIGNSRDMKVGETYELDIFWGTKSQKPEGDSAAFLSDHPDIVAVDEYGKLTALKPGNATIKIWSEPDPENQHYFKVNVTYDTVDTPMTPSIEGGAFFYSREEMAEIYPDLYRRETTWNAQELYDMMVNKVYGAYLCSDVYCMGRVQYECLYVYADQSNADVAVYDTVLSETALREVVANRFGVAEDKISQEGIDDAVKILRDELREETEKYRNMVYLSALPSDTSYKVYVQLFYELHSITHYRSNDSLHGAEGIPPSDYLALDTDAIWDTYTHTETVYMMTHPTCRLVIEKCPVEG